MRNAHANESEVEMRNLWEDLVLDERVLRADLLRVEGRVEGLLCFDAGPAIAMLYIRVLKIQKLLKSLTA